MELLGELACLIALYALRHSWASRKKRKSNHFITRALAREKNFLQKLLHPKCCLLLKTECWGTYRLAVPCPLKRASHRSICVNRKAGYICKLTVWNVCVCVCVVWEVWFGVSAVCFLCVCTQIKARAAHAACDYMWHFWGTLLKLHWRRIVLSNFETGGFWSKGKHWSLWQEQRMTHGDGTTTYLPRKSRSKSSVRQREMLSEKERTFVQVNRYRSRWWCRWRIKVAGEEQTEQELLLCNERFDFAKRRSQTLSLFAHWIWLRCNCAIHYVT